VELSAILLQEILRCRMDNIFIIIGILWVAYVGYCMIKKEGKKGVVTLAFLVVAALLWASGSKFGLDGGVAAVVLSGLFVVGAIIYEKKKKL